MDIAELFKSLKPSAKTVVTAFVFIMPFWFLALESFSTAFIIKKPLYLHIVASFVLSICWIYAGQWNERLTDHITGRQQSKTKDRYRSIVFNSITLLGITYGLNYYNELSFNYYVGMNFGFMALLIVIQLGLVTLSEFMERLKTMAEDFKSLLKQKR